MRPLSISNCAGESSLALQPLLDIKAARPLKEMLLQALAKSEPLTLDASLVERVSTACIQVLLAFASAMAAAGVPFTLAQPSQPLVEAFANLGLGPVLQKWEKAENANSVRG